ncbi:MAG: hypothetical protein ABWY04_08680 [Arthrobacter sp.]
MTSEQRCEATITDITSKHGRIDVLIHAAGVLGTTPGNTPMWHSLQRTRAPTPPPTVPSGPRNCLCGVN